MVGRRGGQSRPGGRITLVPECSQAQSPSVSWSPLPMTAKERSRAKKSRTAWGQERHLTPHLKVPLAGGGGLSSTRRRGWLGVLGAAEREPAGLEGGARGQRGRGVDALTPARRRPRGADLLHLHSANTGVSKFKSPKRPLAAGEPAPGSSVTPRAGAQSASRWGPDPARAGTPRGAPPSGAPSAAGRGGGASPGPASPWLLLPARARPFLPGVQSSGWPRPSREPSALGAAVPLPPPPSPECARGHGPRGGAGRLSPGTR